MDATKIRELIVAKATQSGIKRLLDMNRSQFLDMPEGPFVEVVLTDGAKLAEFADIAESVTKQARANGVDVDVILRTNWRIVSVEYVGMAPSSSGGLRMAERFRAVLQSGKLSQEVLVDVTWDALERLKKKSAELPKSISRRNAIVKDIVIRFLELQVSLGGASYWDPVRFPRQDLDAAAMGYMLTSELARSGA